MKIKNIIFFGLLALTLITGCNKKEDIDGSVVSETKLKDMTLKLQTTTGESITAERKNGLWLFKEYPNKVVLLNFFATWCPPCKAEIPHLNNLLTKYQNDFQVISVVVEQNKSNDDLATFIAQNNIKYPITNSSENFELANAVGGVSSIPAMFLYDKTGKLVMNYVGAVHEEILDSDISKHIGK